MRADALRDELSALEAQEPECACSGEGDVWIAWGCEYHDERSTWNRERVRLQQAIEDAEFVPSKMDTEWEREMEDAA